MSFFFLIQHLWRLPATFTAHYNIIVPTYYIISVDIEYNITNEDKVIVSTVAIDEIYRVSTKKDNNLIII